MCVFLLRNAKASLGQSMGAAKHVCIQHISLTVLTMTMRIIIGMHVISSVLRPSICTGAVIGRQWTSTRGGLEDQRN
jgi:hypothetical protein